MADKYEILATDLLPRIHWLGGPSYTEDDVIRLAEDIARPGWLDRLHAALEDWCPAAVKTFLEAVNAEREHCNRRATRRTSGTARTRRVIMELADQRGGGVSFHARKSLRAFKKTPRYRFMLKGLLERRENASMSDTERRRLRLERLLAGSELDQLRRGEPLSEFSGVLALPDPLDGLHEEVDE